jgi:amino acid permease
LEIFAFTLWFGFFSVGGDVAIPEVCKLLNREKDRIKSAIFWGTVVAAIIIALFVVSVVGATGAMTTADSLTGLDRVLDGKIIKFALLFGLLNVATSFFTGLQAVREVYWWDFGLDKNKAWLLSIIPPILIFILGARNLTAL